MIRTRSKCLPCLRAVGFAVLACAQAWEEIAYVNPSATNTSRKHDRKRRNPDNLKVTKTTSKQTVTDIALALTLDMFGSHPDLPRLRVSVLLPPAAMDPGYRNSLR